MWAMTHTSPAAPYPHHKSVWWIPWEYAAKNMGFLLHLALSLELWFHPGRGTSEIGNTLPLHRSPTLDQTVEQFVSQGIVKK